MEMYAIVIFLLVLSALFSGLTLGLMGEDPHDLKRKADIGNRDAQRVYAVRKNGNLLLTTLLIGNVLVNSILSVLLGSITTGIIAVIVSTVLIVIFGEIVPQAVFNKHALAFGARLSWFVRICVIVLYPLARPISFALDKALGAELPTLYSKQELMHIIEEHEDAGGSVDADEERIIKGALSFSDAKVRDVMTPRSVVRAYDTTDVVTSELLREVRESGVSRFPVFNNDTDRVEGVLYGSSLIGIELHGQTVSSVMEHDVRTVHDSDLLDSALQHFLKTHKHLAIVEDEFGSVVGVITLEDILEEILRTEIIDERDAHADLRALAQQRRKNIGS